MQRLFLFSIVFLFVGGTKLWAQSLTQDLPFFERQTAVYQRWLDQSGLGQYLQVYTIEVENEELKLYLETPYEHDDSVYKVWTLLKEDFEAKSPLSLEQQLFLKMVHVMEIDPEQANVILLATYDPSKYRQEHHYFLRAIYYEQGTIQINYDGPRAESIKVYLKPPNIGTQSQDAVIAFHKQYNKTYVFDTILSYAEKRFTQPNCKLRAPRFQPLISGREKILNFRVSDLCQEVLTEEINPLICEWLRKLGKPCNWITREMLEFTVTYEPTLEGIKIEILVDGSVGSGYHRSIKRGAYYPMETEFKKELHDYAQLFKEDIYQLFE